MPEPNSGCMLWLGAVNHKGYAVSHGKGVYRRLYERAHGPLPKGIVPDHKCRVRICVNEAHLEPVTNRENVMRGEGACAKNARKTHCKHGHPLTPDNLVPSRPPGIRDCLSCHRRDATQQNDRRNPGRRRFSDRSEQGRYAASQRWKKEAV